MRDGGARPVIEERDLDPPARHAKRCAAIRTKTPSRKVQFLLRVRFTDSTWTSSRPRQARFFHPDASDGRFPS
jgi:hypothetical protein